MGSGSWRRAASSLLGASALPGAGDERRGSGPLGKGSSNLLNTHCVANNEQTASPCPRTWQFCNRPWGGGGGGWLRTPYISVPSVGTGDAAPPGSVLRLGAARPAARREGWDRGKGESRGPPRGAARHRRACAPPSAGARGARYITVSGHAPGEESTSPRRLAAPRPAAPSRRPGWAGIPPRCATSRRGRQRTHFRNVWAGGHVGAEAANRRRGAGRGARRSPGAVTGRAARWRPSAARHEESARLLPVPEPSPPAEPRGPAG